MVATFGAAIFGTFLPFSSVANAMKFGPLNGEFLWIVAALLLCYLVLTTIVKHFYMKKEKFLI